MENLGFWFSQLFFCRTMFFTHWTFEVEDNLSRLRSVLRRWQPTTERSWELWSWCPTAPLGRDASQGEITIHLVLRHPDLHRTLSDPSSWSHFTCSALLNSNSLQNTSRNCNSRVVSDLVHRAGGRSPDCHLRRLPGDRKLINTQAQPWKPGRPKGLCFYLVSTEGDWLWVSNCCRPCNLILEFMYCVSNLEIGITHNLYLTLAVHLEWTGALCLRFLEPWEVYLACSRELTLNICA